MADQQDRSHAPKATESLRLKSQGTVPAMDVAEQLVGWIRLDLDPLDHCPEQQPPACMIRIGVEPGADPTKGVRECNAQFFSHLRF